MQTQIESADDPERREAEAWQTKFEARLEELADRPAQTEVGL